MADTSDTRDLLLNQLADEFALRQRAGERPRLEEYCERHPDLADDIRSLFPALVELERVKADAGPDLAVEVAGAPPVTHLGDFRLLREVGRGGMGVVYEAEQVSLGRRVAIKLLPASVFRDPNKRRRFEREARAAAKLHHTNIVPVHGFGEHDGTPYYVMQFIPGLGLDVVIDELGRLPADGRAPTPDRPRSAEAALSVVLARSLLGADGAGTAGWNSPADNGPADNAPTTTSAGGITPDPAPLPRPDRGSTVSLSTSGVLLPGQSGSGAGKSSGKRTTYWESVARIGVQVAGALAYAHKQGVLHRDIKPANLLLDLDGIVWVTDFGLAKADDSDNLTHTGDLLGTLRYMPPEAFEGHSDARSDVYALGLTLFELVALRPAYEERDRNKLIKAVTTGEPPRLRKLRKDAPRDLVTIVEKATDKDPARRYQSAGALADDLQRFMDGRPITARRATELERLWMWARRRPAMAGLVAALFLCLLVGSVVSTVFAIRADRFARDAELREKDATAARDTARRNAEEAKDARNAAAREAARLLLDQGIKDARGGEPARALHLFVQALEKLRVLPADDPQAAPLERVIRANLTAWAETVPALEHIWPGGIQFEDAVFSPDGELLVLPFGPDGVQCFRTDTGRPAGPRLNVPVTLGTPMVFAPDGRSLWVAAPGRNKVLEPGAVHRFDPVTGRALQPLIPTAAPLGRLLVTPDGRHLVGSVVGLHPGDRGGEQDASGTRKWRTASIVVWEVETGKVVRTEVVNAESNYATANGWPDTYLSLTPDAKAVTAWVERGANRFEQLTFALEGKEPPVRHPLPAVGAGGRWKLHFENAMRSGLVLKDDRLHRWSAAEPGALGPGTATPFHAMQYDPSADGRSVISHEGRIFDTGAWPPRPSGVRFSHPGWQRSMGWSAQSSDGRFLATWMFEEGSDRRLWRLPRPHSRPAIPPAEQARQPEHPHDKYAAQFDPRGASAILWWPPRTTLPEEAYTTHSVQVVDAATGATRVTSVRHSKLVREIAFSPDGRHFATASFDGTARVWEAATGRPAGPPLQHENYVAAVAFSPDGTTLAAGDYARQVKLWDWRAGKEVRAPLLHDDIALSVSFSPDGRHLAVVKAKDWSGKPELLVWELASGTAVVRMGHANPPYILREPIRFRPDGRVMTMRDINGVLRLWEVPTDKRLGEPRPLDGDGVTRFSPDGRVVAAAANLGVRLLDGDTLEPLPAGYLPHPDPITDLAFGPGGALLLTAHESGSAQLWDVATRKSIGPPAVLIGPIRAISFTPDGKTCLCVAADGTVRRWPVPAPFAEPDLDRLRARVVLMTAQKMDSNQGLESVAADEWRDLRKKLVGDGSTALVPPRADADWHDGRAADAEQDGDAIGAGWHLDRLAKTRPDDWTIPARRGRVLARAGRPAEAAAAYDHAARLTRSPRDLADWLRTAATDDEVSKRYDGALWNIDRAIRLTPGDWVPYAVRAALLDRAGHADRAAADVDTAVRLGADFIAVAQAAERLADRATQPRDWARVAHLFTTAAKNPLLTVGDRYYQALACLKAGDAAGYRAACAGIVGRMPPAETPIKLVDALTGAWAARAGPGATEDWSAPLSWVDRILARIAERGAADPRRVESDKPLRQVFLHLRGALLYRAGRTEEAVALLRDPASLHPLDNEFANWAFLALAEHRLGHADAAKGAAAKARALQAKSPPGAGWDRAELELLAAELEAALPAGK